MNSRTSTTTSTSTSTSTSVFERFFFSPYGSSRAYLFSKVFLLMLALDTWMLMIGHAGRYGMAGFNVAHFAWLDAIQPTPTASSYVAVLILTGLLALVLVLTGLRRWPALALFLLYTFSWSMSMLDSYQHHYFVSLVLLCLVFFPEIGATEIHPLPKAAPAKEKQKRKQHAELERSARIEWRGLAYALFVVAAAATYYAVEVSEHAWLAFFAFAGSIALATWLLAPRLGAPLLRPGFGFPLLGATCWILYTYTAIAKMDASWVDGHTLRSISSVERVFAGLADYGEELGMTRDKVWSLMATGVIPQELSIGVCYLLAAHQDRLGKGWITLLCSLGFCAAVMLHVGAEAMGLQIGWFSYYMLALACCFLLPLPVVDRLAMVFTWPARLALRHADEWRAQSPPTRVQNAGLAAACGAMLVLVGQRIDLPGSLAACVLAALVLLGFSVYASGRGSAIDPRRYSVATIVAAIGMWLAISASPVRFDFYRYLAGDLKRRGDPEAALATYEHSERYAPAGQSRAKAINELRRQLGK
jgi:hypothetical protein